jgi:hypothetical protein
MMLVDASEEHLRAALKELPDWIMMPEKTVPVPDPRKRVSQPADKTKIDERS